jgi:hypothetical protein
MHLVEDNMSGRLLFLAAAMSFASPTNSYAESQVGRYQVFSSSSPATVLMVDTATGRTWLMPTAAAGEAIEWKPLLFWGGANARSTPLPPDPFAR